MDTRVILSISSRNRACGCMLVLACSEWGPLTSLRQHDNGPSSSVVGEGMFSDHLTTIIFSSLFAGLTKQSDVTAALFNCIREVFGSNHG
jgi:hypothetical protein